MLPFCMFDSYIKLLVDDDQNINIVIDYRPFLLEFPWDFEVKIDQNTGLTPFQGSN